MYFVLLTREAGIEAHCLRQYILYVYVYVLMMGKNGGWYIVTLVFCINFPEKKVYDFSNCAIFCNFRCSFFIYELTDTPKGI